MITPNDCFAELSPPPEVVEMGTPERVYRSPAVGPARVIATYLMASLALVLAGGLVVLKDVFGMVPEHVGTIVYVLGSGLLVGAVLMILSLAVMRAKRPNYLYAFYPVGLVICQKGEWGLVPWVHVTCLDERSDPALVLENQAVIPIAHDFPDGFDLVHDIRQCVLAKDGLLGNSVGGRAAPPPPGRGALQLLAGAALLVGAGVTTFLTWDWMVEMNTPAREMSSDELVRLKDPATVSRGWVSLNVPQVIKTDVEMEQRRFGIAVTESKVVLIPINDKYLIANVKNDFKGGKEVKGVLSVWRGDAGRYSQTKLKAVDAVVQGSAKYRNKLLPFQFDATIPLESNAKVLPACLAVAGLLGLGMVLSGWGRSRRRPPLQVTV